MNDNPPFKRISLEERFMLEPPLEYHLMRRLPNCVEFTDGQTIERWEWLGYTAKSVTRRSAT